MKWIEVKLSVDGEAAEAITEVLQRYGHQGISMEQEGIMPEAWDEDNVPPAERLTIRAYLPNDDQAPEAKVQLENALKLMGMMYPMPTPEYTLIDDEDWAEAWKKHYHPIRLGRHILVRPIWAEVDLQPGDIEISLDPGMAFGTGTHPTTQLCLQTLEDLVKPGDHVLDLGSGSGILSIAAAKLGAAEVLGLDIDRIAVTSSQENIDRNSTADKITIQQGSLETVIHSSRRFDMVVVNILARIIIQMCDEGLGQTVRPGGIAMFSGIIDNQADEVEAALRKTGLEPYARRRKGDWVVVEARRPHDTSG